MSIYNTILNFNDISKIGLDLAFDVFNKVSDDSAVIPPLITELSSGFYKFSFDVTATNDDIYYVVSDGGSNILTGILALNNDNTIDQKIVRILGLDQENQFIDNTVYDGNGNLTSGRIRLYSLASDVGTNLNVIATYLITATYTTGKLATYKVALQ